MNINPSMNNGTHIKEYQVCEEAGELPGSPLSLLSKLEMPFTIGDNSFVTHIELWHKIVSAIVEECQKHNFGAARDDYTKLTSSWCWIERMDKHYSSLRRLRCDSVILMTMLPFFKKFLNLDYNNDSLWLATKNQIASNVFRWIDALDNKLAKFDQGTGYSLEKGATRFNAKYLFQPIIKCHNSKTVWEQWERQWMIYDEMAHVVTDEKKVGWHKLNQWCFYLKQMLLVAKNLQSEYETYVGQQWFINMHQ